MFAALMLSTLAMAGTGTPYTIERTPVAPTIDGDLSEFTTATTLPVVSGNASVDLRLIWDDTAIYLGAVVTDPVLSADQTAHDSGLWQDDALEMMFDLGNEGGTGMAPGDFKVFISVLGTVSDNEAFDTSWDPQFPVVVIATGTVLDNNDTDAGYVVEAQFPFASWPTAVPTNGTQWGFELSLNNEDVPGSVLQTAWSNTTGGGFNDPDGFGLLEFSDVPIVTDVDGDGHDTTTDCDDSDPDVHPGAVETCDGVDEDCNNQIDDNPTDPNTYWLDADGDGAGDPNTSTQACSQPSGYASTDDDCDDSTDLVSPTALETCDNIDNDCNGLVDDNAGGQLWYEDADGDGFGDDTLFVTACVKPSGYEALAGDCDDDDDTTYPGAVERCDGVDNDCDLAVDESVTVTTWFSDADGDGFGDADAPLQSCDPPTGYVRSDTDCNDDDDTIHPGATEVWYDGVDQDCDGNDDDQDEDGVSHPDDCDDLNALVQDCDALGRSSARTPTSDGSPDALLKPIDAGCACSSTVSGGAWWLVGMAVLVGRRDR